MSIQALLKQQVPHQREPQRGGLIERPNASQPWSSAAFFGGHILLLLAPAAFFGAPPSASTATAQCLADSMSTSSSHRPFEVSAPPSYSPTCCLGLLCLALPTGEHHPFWPSICQLLSVKPCYSLTLKDLFPFAQTWDSMGWMKWECE